MTSIFSLWLIYRDLYYFSYMLYIKTTTNKIVYEMIIFILFFIVDIRSNWRVLKSKCIQMRASFNKLSSFRPFVHFSMWVTFLCVVKQYKVYLYRYLSGRGFSILLYCSGSFNSATTRHFRGNHIMYIYTIYVYSLMFFFHIRLNMRSTHSDATMMTRLTVWDLAFILVKISNFFILWYFFGLYCFLE